MTQHGIHLAIILMIVAAVISFISFYLQLKGRD